MKPGWEIKTLGEVCEIYQPTTLSTKELDESGRYFVYGANGIIGRYSKYNHEESEVILTCRGSTCGTINVSLPFSWINGNAMVVRPKDKTLLKEYLKYLLRGIDYSKVITGAAQPQITRIKLAPLVISFPKSIPEQQRIVDILDQEFAKIDALKANAEKSLQAAKDLFQATLKKELEPKDGWKHNAMAEIADMCLGKMLDRSKNTGVMQPYLRNVNVRWDGFDLEDLLSMPFEEREQERYGIKDGDIIMCEGGEPARCAIWAGQIPGMKIQKALHRIRMHNGLFNRFVMYSFLHYNNTGLLNSYISGATIKHLTGEKLKQVILYYPDYLTQIAIATSLDEQNSRCKSIQENYQKTLTLCDDLKQSLLRKAFNGEL